MSDKDEGTAMPLRDRHGKSTKDYRESLITALDAISPQRPAKKGNPAIWIWLLVPVAALWLNWSQVATYFKPLAAAAKLPTLAVKPALVSIPALPVSPIPAAAPETRIQPQPLSKCLAAGTVVDEQVLRCRFGAVPRPQTEPEPSHGMVSAAYMAKYVAERNARPKTSSVGGRQVISETHWISGWDGNGSYEATWQVVNNEVDSSSVCLDYRRGSIEYRECRKGAKQWFKDQCRAADSNSDTKRRRYCSAASSFSPMG
jgi:hypothetical protein